KGGQIGLAIDGGRPALVRPDGTPIITTGGGRLISQDGAGLISQDGAGLISQDGAGLIGQDGAGLIGQDGAGLIGQDGAGLIGQDGAGFRVSGGNVISNDGGSIAPPASPLSTKNNSSLNNEGGLIHPMAAGDLASGIRGLFMARSSGGQDPVIETSTDPVTGEVSGFVTMTFDATSFPRANNLQGLAFTLVVNP